MVCDLVELIDALDMSAYDCLLLLEYPNRTIHLHIQELVVIEILQGGGYLVLPLLIEYHLERLSGIVDFKQGAHRLLLLPDDPAYDNDLRY